jgi:hypothetical protein
MPARILRVMKEEEGRPVTGNGPAALGVRLKDVGLNEDAPDATEVNSGAGGMSVAGCLWTLSATLLPKRFEIIDPERFRGARASNSQKVWRRGDGPYEPSPISTDLDLRIDDRSEPPGHGSVEPNRPMPMGDYRASLADTRDEWQVDEGHPNDCPVCKHYGFE